MSPLLLVLLTGAVVIGVDRLARRRRPPREPMSRSDWHRLARRCGLSVRTEPPGLHGTVGTIGVSVDISDEPDALCYRVHAGHRVALPAGFRLAAGAGAPLASPILSGQIRAEGTAGLLDDPDMVGPLMAVFHRWPEATADAHGVNISGQTRQPRRELPEAIAAAAALADAVSDRWPSAR